MYEKGCRCYTVFKGREKERAMSVEKVGAYLETLQLDDRIIVLEQSSATVDETAIAVGCEGQTACRQNL